MGRKSRAKFEKRQVHALLLRRQPSCVACQKAFDPTMDHDVQPEGVCWRCPCGEVTVGRAIFIPGEEGFFISVPLSELVEEMDGIAAQEKTGDREPRSLPGY
ncbi:MAG: hypothetical protein HYU30_05040 [Chloroflexi bacterium]|nr:hypothetical protein [Chloroflexota bacterium]